MGPGILINACFPACHRQEIFLFTVLLTHLVTQTKRPDTVFRALKVLSHLSHKQLSIEGSIMAGPWRRWSVGKLSALNRVRGLIETKSETKSDSRIQIPTWSALYLQAYIIRNYAQWLLILLFLLIWVTKPQRNKVGLGAPDQETKVIAGRCSDQSIITKRLHQRPHEYIMVMHHNKPLWRVHLQGSYY